MAIDDDMKPGATIPALFAEITALLEDAHEIAARGQNSKLNRADYRAQADDLRRALDQIQTLSETVQLAVH